MRAGGDAGTAGGPVKLEVRQEAHACPRACEDHGGPGCGARRRRAGRGQGEGVGLGLRAQAPADAPAVRDEARIWAARRGEPGPGSAAGGGRRGRCPRGSLDLWVANFFLWLCF